MQRPRSFPENAKRFLTAILLIFLILIVFYFYNLTIEFDEKFNRHFSELSAQINELKKSNLGPQSDTFDENINRRLSDLSVQINELKNSILIPKNDSFEEYLKGPIKQDDPRLIKYIKDFILIPPANDNEEYNLELSSKDPSMGQSTIIKQIFGDKREGKFIECGAYDGELRSNTLSLEKDFGWQGLLIEANRDNFQKLKLKKRKSWSAGVCLSTTTYPVKMSFNEKKTIGKIMIKGEQLGNNEKGGNIAEIQCLPFYSILKAVGFDTVDYFSLDIEGHEYKVLETFPFELLDIKTFSIEFSHVKEGEKGIRDFMKTKGYTEVAKVINQYLLAHDMIFVHKTFQMKNTTEIKSIYS